MNDLYEIEYSQKAEQVIGEYCLYKESGIRAIVLVKQAIINDDVLTTKMFVLAQCYARTSHHNIVGTEIQVGASLKGGWNQIWQLFLLRAKNIEDAIIEVDPPLLYKWIKIEDGYTSSDEQ